MGKDLSAVSMLPSGQVEQFPGTSQKPNSASRPIYRARINWSWVHPDGESPAPNAQIIYYPQYPEVRLSGFLRESLDAPRELLNPALRGKEPGRILLIGVGPDERVYGTLVSSSSPAAAEIRAKFDSEDTSLLTAFLGGESEPATLGRSLLLNEFRRIHRLGWVPAAQLQADGTFGPCTGNRCGGHTLEAHLGITANGRAEPDFAGWEVKQYGVAGWHRAANKPVTLFTPQPDLGLYATHDTTWFVRRYGRQRGANRFDFTGRHFIGRGPNPTTGLSLELEGYDPSATLLEDRVLSDGALKLLSPQGEVVAGWSFAKLLQHWKRKHSFVAYIPSMSRRTTELEVEFSFGSRAELGIGTSFPQFLQALAEGHISYDPGCNTVLRADGTWQSKPRNQIRIKHKMLNNLYDEFETADLSND